MSNTSKRPSHRIYAVTKIGEDSNWREIGAAWAHQDGDGFSLKLDCLPLNGAEIVLRKPKPKAAARPTPQQRANPTGRPSGRPFIFNTKEISITAATEMLSSARRTATCSRISLTSRCSQVCRFPCLSCARS